MEVLLFTFSMTTIRAKLVDNFGDRVLQSRLWSIYGPCYILNFLWQFQLLVCIYVSMYLCNSKN